MPTIKFIHVESLDSYLKGFIYAFDVQFYNGNSTKYVFLTDDNGITVKTGKIRLLVEPENPDKESFVEVQILTNKSK